MASLGKIHQIGKVGKTDKQHSSIANKAFLWSLGYLKPYKGLLIAGMVCAVLHSVFYTAGISALVPVLKLLVENEGLHTWVYRAAAEHRLGAEMTAYDPRLDGVIDGATIGLPVIRRLKTQSPLEVLGIGPGDVLEPVALAASTQPAHALSVYEAVQHAEASVQLRVVQSAGNRARAPLADPVLTLPLKTPDTKWSWLARVVNHLPVGQTRTGRLQELAWVLGVLLAVNIIGNILRYFAEYLVAKSTFRAMVDLRGQMYAKALKLPMSFFKDSIADTTSRFVQDTQALSRSILLLFGKVAREPLKAVGAFVLLLYLDARLTLFLLIAGVPCYFLVRKAGRIINRATQRLLVGYGHMLKGLEATFVGLRVVKAYNAEDFESGRFGGVDRQMLRQFNTLAKVEAGMSPLIESISLVAAAVGLLWLATKVLDGGMTPTDFMAIGVVLAAMFDPIRKIAAVWNRVQGGGVAAQRIREMLDTPDETVTIGGSVQLAPLASQITLENVTFRYPGTEVPALVDINLTVRRGQKVAIVGPNGCGKTTLVSLLPRFYRPDQGRITWDGVDLASADLHSLRRQIGLISQETIVFPLSVRENIAYGQPEISDERIREAAAAAHALEFIDDPKSCPQGLDTLLGEQGVGLSGGQRQRIALARLILRDAPVLIMDEATSAADAESEARIYDALLEHAKDKTLIVIAHRFRTVQNAEVIVVMDQGRIIDQGPHNALYDRCSRYRALCDYQFSS